jgi:hydrogenase maturation protein HypF
MQVRSRINVCGIVQGVGFRPYIYRLATERGLSGTVTNTSSGVTIEIQGPTVAVEDFVACLPRQAPPIARITDVSVLDLPCNGDHDFRILSSQRGDAVHTLISPDIAICNDCLRELFDPRDRRYHYSFINCTNCGPRFTIVRDIPYDRPYTSMAVFPMCAACQAEYDDPLNRRFHAQPNACQDCGPHVELWEKDGTRIEGTDPIVAAVSALRSGHVVAVKGLGGFHLAVDATNSAAVALLRERKRRVEKPFAIMVPNLGMAQRLCEVEDAAGQALQSVERPVVLLPRRGASPVVKEVAPFNRDLGVFLPYTPLHHLLLSEGKFDALVMTSGNLSEEPIAIDNCEAVARLATLADYFLVHNRDILLRCDDSVVRIVSGKPAQMRRSRGYVPVPVFLKQEVPQILAVGGELKNTIAVSDGNRVFLSQHIGDLENLEGYKFFQEGVDHLQKILEIRPQIVAYDLHPDYFSTKWALKQPSEQRIGVQHHHAHIASCMAENLLDGPVIGFALDGTGYGTDGNIWGGEVLIADYGKFERAAHFEYVPMPGGNAAVREPWRMAISYLVHHFGDSFKKFKVPFVQRLNQPKVDLLQRMTERGVNTPLTSSCGRLFDAVAALAGVRQVVNYEAQAAIELEMAIRKDSRDSSYPMELLTDEACWTIGTKPLFEALIEDLGRGIPISRISRRFHDGLIDSFSNVADRLRQRTSLKRVCLSGGTFNNLYLLTRLRSRLESESFEVFTHSAVPAGDGG